MNPTVNAAMTPKKKGPAPMLAVSMKAAAVFPGKPGSVHLATMPKPMVEDIPNGRGVLVKVLRVGLDGTDKEINAAEYGAAPPGFDFLVFGHESFGMVEEVGPNVTELVPGDYVVASDPEYAIGTLGSGTLHDVRVDIVDGAVMSPTSWVPWPTRAQARSRSPTPLVSPKRRLAGGPRSKSRPTMTTAACAKFRCSLEPRYGRSSWRARARCSRWRKPTRTDGSAVAVSCQP